MKITEGFMLRKVGDEFVVITLGEAVDKFNGMIKLNGTGVFIWNALLEETSLDDLIAKVSREYGIDHKLAEQDVKAFLASVKSTGCFTE